ncbi:MAG: glutathione S-transferase, partial [Rhodobacteraceae bacterium]|nr:glutathione S-transferase [Paracoccaceae bacterium]
MAYPILYSFRRCPYAMRARLAIFSAELKHEHREILLKEKP